MFILHSDGDPEYIVPLLKEAIKRSKNSEELYRTLIDLFDDIYTEIHGHLDFTGDADYEYTLTDKGDVVVIEFSGQRIEVPYAKHL